MRFLHTIGVMNGSQLAQNNLLKVALLAGVAIAAAVGPITGAQVSNPGSGYTSIPTIVVPVSGSSGVITAKVGAQTFDFAAAGSGYAPGDTIILTGGTFDQAAAVQLLTTKLASLALNAAGTGYTPNDTITLAGGSFTSPGRLTVAGTTLVSNALNAPGTGYVATEIITLAGGTHSVSATVTVTDIKLVSVALNAAGSGYGIGDTVTLAGGTSSTKAVITVDTLGASNAIATFHISNGGAYTVGSTTFTQFATSGSGTGATFQTGVFGVNTYTISAGGTFSVNAAAMTQASSTGSGTGATFQNSLFGVKTVSVLDGGSYSANSATFTQSASSGGGTGATFQTGSFGALTAKITNPGIYSVLASNPLSQGSTSGSGTGATVDLLTFGVVGLVVGTPGTGYTNGAALTASGGGGSGFAGFVTTALANETVEVQVNTITELPPSYSVFVTPNGPALVTVTNKTATGFLVSLTPYNSGGVIGASTMDLLVVG